ncbi:hypothetical protein SteCoe_4394 [Stentor coeruleus]|uniref:EF-hand domain-containing protein n=1 Tax=Stentor coeruleus TaxID=5963 RepID=A0A1R2CUU5_9CILI|nr:hypothetical protein SteCoe_4394 [Stentor coeruleus]
MGNLILYASQKTRNVALYSLVDPCYKFLCEWSRGDISKFRHYFGKSFFFLKSEVKRIANLTRLQGYEDLLFNYFTLKANNKVNVMEVFAAVITFSEMPLTDKIHVAFKLFDFDGSKTISDDEFFIMCKCFVEAIALLTNGTSCSNMVLKQTIENSCQDSLNSEGLTDWIKSNPSIFFALNNTAPAVSPENYKMFVNMSLSESKTNKKITKTFDKRHDIYLTHRRAKSSLSQEKNYLVVVDGSPINKSKISDLKKIYDNLNKKSNPQGKILREELLKKGFENAVKLPLTSTFGNFRDLVSALYPTANQGQIARLLALINISTPLPRKGYRKKPTSEVKKIEVVFKKYDKNGDGVIDLNELKIALEPNFTDDAINELYIQHSRRNSGLHIEEFTDMFLQSP